MTNASLASDLFGANAPLSPETQVWRRLSRLCAGCAILAHLHHNHHCAVKLVKGFIDSSHLLALELLHSESSRIDPA